MRSLQTGGLIVICVFLAAFAPLGNTVGDDSTIPPSAEQAGADVQGVVILNVPDPAAPTRLSPYARRRYSPPAPANESRTSPQSVVVYILVEGQTGSGEGQEVVIGQKNRTVSPIVTVIQKGTRIRFPNDDDVFHNLFSLSAARPFNLGRYAPGTSRSVVFDQAGVVRLFCDIHSEMSGTILVLDTPYFATPDAKGNFVIRDVPAGRHQLVAWHESTGAITSTIVVPASGTVRTELRLPG
jgi:plastocyanin